MENSQEKIILQPSRTDIHFIEQLRDGNEEAFTQLLDLYYASMLRVALIYVREQEIAEDVVQETWIGVLRGLKQFEGRSSLKTWIFSILVNQARTRAQREGRYVPLTAEEDDRAPAVDPEYFLPPDHPRNPGHWVTTPNDWGEIPEERFLSEETMQQVYRAIEQLSPHQREVITLRDIEGLSSDEICNILTISETNQRVLLHRARSAVRRALEKYLEK